jgi:hypothetical protein
VKVIGVEKNVFKDKQDPTKEVELYHFHCAEPVNQKHGVGHKGVDFWLALAKASEIFGDPFSAKDREINVYFNQYGKVAKVDIVK